MTRVLTALALTAGLAVAGRGRRSAVAEESRVADRDRRPPTYKVRLDTSAGPVVIQVTRAWAPLGADRFYNLVKNGFYDGVALLPRHSRTSWRRAA